MRRNPHRPEQRIARDADDQFDRFANLEHGQPAPAVFRERAGDNFLQGVYVLFVLLVTLLPWDDAGVSKSPYVAVLERAGVAAEEVAGSGDGPIQQSLVLAGACWAAGACGFTAA